MRLFLSLFFTFIIAGVYAQEIVNANPDSTSVVVSQIIIAGNSKTKTNIITREIVFKIGDTLSLLKLAEELDVSRNQIFNTTLFDEVTFHTAIINKNQLTVIFTVKERWYIFPLPYFKLADRNFNEWWVTHKGSLDRVDYGLKFYHNNLTGNNDKLVVDAITGYTRQFGVRYNLPFFDKKMTKGLSFGFAYIKQKEINYNTGYGNKPLLIKALQGFPKTITRIDATYTNRPDLFFRHSVRASYGWETIDDFIAYINPNYYKGTATSINYLDLNYTANYSKTNYNVYPTKGFAFSAGASVRLFNGENNLYSFGAAAMFAHKLSNKTYVRNRVAASFKLPVNTGYSEQAMFGYNAFQLRGMEYYVVDGTVGLLHKMTVGYNIFNFNINIPYKNKYIDKIPFKIYAKVYNDIGYCYSKNINTNLNDRILHGYGIGVDIMTFYDIVFTLEYSFNNLGKSGAFLGNPQ